MLLAIKKAVIKKKVPICWYGLESSIKEEGEKKGHGIVSKVQCEDVGQMLGMTNV